MSFADDVRALIAKVAPIKTKAASLAALTAGYRQKYRAIVDQATSIEQARLLLSELDAELQNADAQVVEAVAANTDENDNGIPDRDEPPPAGSTPTTPDEPLPPIV